MTTAILRMALTLAAELALGATAQAQTGQWGQYRAPAWGQHGTAWGQYTGNLGVTWQYNRTLAPVDPAGSVLSPNQANTNFSNPSTASGPFAPQDTRLRGRDRP